MFFVLEGKFVVTAALNVQQNTLLEKFEYSSAEKANEPSSAISKMEAAYNGELEWEKT